MRQAFKKKKMKTFPRSNASLLVSRIFNLLFQRHIVWITRAKIIFMVIGGNPREEREREREIHFPKELCILYV